MAENVRIKSAARSIYRHQYNPWSLFTLDFGELKPSRLIEVLPNDEFSNIEAHGPVRVAPPDFPAYGSLKLRSAAFYVPSYQIIESADAFRAGQSTFKGKPVVIPSIKVYFLNAVLRDPAYSSVVTTITDSDDAPSSEEFDFMYPQFGTTVSYKLYKLNTKGKYVYSVLKGLGYDFYTYLRYSGVTQADVENAHSNLFVNAMPILAYFRIYFDMFFNQQMYNSSYAVKYLHQIHDSENIVVQGTNYFNASNGHLSANLISFFFQQLFVPHQQGLYLQAWNLPNAPINGLEQIKDFGDISDNSLVKPYMFGTESAHAYENGTALYKELGTSNSMTLSAWGLKVLQGFYDIARRYHLFGSKSAQRVFANFGVKTDDYRSNFVHKLFDNSDDLDFTAVMSNSDTSADGTSEKGKTLGSYAGFARGDINVKFDYQAKDFGYIIILHWLQVTPIQMHGFDPQTLRVGVFDFFNAKFDGKTIRAVPQLEVSLGHLGKDDTTTNDAGIFGYIGLYDDYRTMRDVVSGDFLTPLAKNFFFGRDLSELRRFTKIKAQDSDVQYYHQPDDDDTNDDMTDVFQFSVVDGERFYVAMKWNIDAKRPIMLRSDSLDLGGEGDLELPINGQQMN